LARRADEARRTAELSDDPVLKKTMMDIAAAYERLVALIDSRRASERQMCETHLARLLRRHGRPGNMYRGEKIERGCG